MAASRRRAARPVVLGAVATAAVVGCLTGVLVASSASNEKFSLAGLAYVPVWFLLEVFFEIVGVGYRIRSKGAQAAVPLALIAGFYFAWFLVR